MMRPTTILQSTDTQPSRVEFEFSGFRFSGFITAVHFEERALEPRQSTFGGMTITQPVFSGPQTATAQVVLQIEAYSQIADEDEEFSSKERENPYDLLDNDVVLVEANAVPQD
jgi:hypothetical protein